MRSPTRAIVPSSFITSQITPAGISPARRARSTAASVWPARSRTPPSRAFSGKTWPGCTRSSGREWGSIATWIVRARSAAEMPVVTPSRASIEIVNAVWNADSFFAAIRSRPSSSQRSGLSARQISPRASFAMKLIASGVANWAAIVRSPSFSRLSSSQTTTIRPRRISSSASSTGENAVVGAGACSGALAIGASSKALHEPLDVPRDEIHLDVRPVTRAQRAERRPREGLGDQCDLELCVAGAGDGQADAVQGDRAARRHVARQLRRELDPNAARVAVLPNPADGRDRVDVSLHEMSPERIACSQRGLEVHPIAVPQVPQRRERERLVYGVRLERPFDALGDREADAGDRDRVARPKLLGELGSDAKPRPRLAAIRALNRPDLANQPGEHRRPYHSCNTAFTLRSPPSSVCHSIRSARRASPSEPAPRPAISGRASRPPM